MPKRKWCPLKYCENKVSGMGVKPGVRVHSFPSCPQMRRKWEDWVNNVNSSYDPIAVEVRPFKAYNGVFLCTTHFDENSYFFGELKRNAVPSVAPEVSLSCAKSKKIRRCCAMLCNNIQGKTSLFTFPSIDDENNIQRCKLWVKHCGNVNLLGFPSTLLRQKYFVCSDHFEDYQFCNKNKNRLVPGAIPTKFACQPLSDEAMSLFPVLSALEASSKSEYYKDTSTTPRFSSLFRSSFGNDPKDLYHFLLTPQGNLPSSRAYNMSFGSDDFYDDAFESAGVPSKRMGSAAGGAKCKKIRRCCAVLCGTIQGERSLFTFPSVDDESSIQRCKMWVKNCGNVNLLSFPSALLRPKYFLCSDHFEDNQFCNKKKNRLVPGAIPTKFNCQSLSEEVMSMFPVDFYFEDATKRATLQATQFYEEFYQSSGALALQTDRYYSGPFEPPATPKKRKWISLSSAKSKKIRKCSAMLCSNVQGKTSLFTFPAIDDENNVHRCKKWVQNSGNVNLLSIPSSSLYQKYFLCSEHFEDNQFCNKKKQRLLPDATPTKFACQPLSDEVMSMFPVAFSLEYTQKVMSSQVTQYYEDSFESSGVPSLKRKMFSELKNAKSKKNCLMLRNSIQERTTLFPFPVVDSAS